MHGLPLDISYDRILSPAVLLFADDTGRRARLSRAIEAAGGRVTASGPLADAVERLAVRGPITGLVVDAREAGEADLDSLLARANRLADGSGRPFVLLVIDHALIDRVAARVTEPGVRILVDPPSGEIKEALAGLVAPAAGAVAEGDGDNSRRLARLSEEVGRIARALAALSADEAARDAMAAPTPGEADGTLLRAILRLRRLRAQHFLPVLFADPAWDMLLDLAAARIEARRVAVSSLCIAASVPATTALRWIAQMTEQGLLVRRPDPLDGRRVFIDLGDATAAAMGNYLAAARRIVMPVT